MKQTDVTVTFYLKKSEMNDEGHCPVMAKLVVGKFSEAAFSAKMSVPALYCGHPDVPRVKSNAAREINRQLDDLRASAISIYDELSATRENVTAEEIRNLLLGRAFGQETLLGYFRTFIEHFEKRVGVNREKGTAQSYRYACNCVAAFIQEKYKLSDVPFTALNRSFIDNYDLYLRTERRFALGTIVLLVTRLNTIVGEAIAEGIITADPFAGYESRTSRAGTEIPYRSGVTTADDHTPARPETLPYPRPVPLLLLHGYPLRGHVPPDDGGSGSGRGR